MNNDQFFAHIVTLHDKYFDLIWYARRRPIHLVIPEVRQKMREIEEKYPEEVNFLKHPESSDWQHGFHSGVLAGLRYVLTLEEEGLASANEQFPELDS